MTELPTRADEAGDGGTQGELLGDAVVLHYGDVAAEYDALRKSAGIVRRPDLAQIRMWGRDPVRMLNGLITNDLGALPGNRAVYAAMLTPKGRMITDLRTFRGTTEGEIILDIPAAASAGVQEQLKKYVPPMFARSEALGSKWSVVGLYGPRAGEILQGAFSLPDLEESEDSVSRARVGNSDIVVIATRVTGEAGFDIFAPADSEASILAELLRVGESRGARRAGMAAVEIARIEAGRPRFGLDINEETLPGEAYESTNSIPRAISFSKGCYTGQEVVIRIAHRGHVNRHLRGLRLGQVSPPPPRTPLFTSGGKEIGWTTSSASSPRFNETIALAILRREIEVGAKVMLLSPDGAEARVVELPFTESQEG